MDTKTGIITAGVAGVTAIAFGRKYFAGSVCRIKKDLTGQVIVITGSNTGIGKETARVLAQMGATVILACRTKEKTLPVVEELRLNTKNQNIEFIRLDLGDLGSIKEFVEEFKRRYNRLDILINNAGISAIPERRLTKDGFELQFGTNHLGHFYLTTLLLDIIKNSAPSRIINLSSGAHAFYKMDWDDLMGEKNYNLWKAYCRSKLANVLFTKELQRRLANLNVKVVAVHPGGVRTGLGHDAAEKWYFKIIANTVAYPLMYIFGKTPLQGAQTSLYCALGDYNKLQGGAYYAEGVIKMENPEANKEENWAKLWEISERLISERLSR